MFEKKQQRVYFTGLYQIIYAYMMERAYDYDNIIIVVTFMKLINYFIVLGQKHQHIDLLWFQGIVFLRHNEYKCAKNSLRGII